ncbi:MAG: hypothetical protein H0T46_35035 [Deltaproteobacteria bacterium]|nr:hypothetical protein [Deltaproteobacteria bacterium]
MVRWLLPLALLGCSPERAKVVRTLGYGMTIEGGVVFAASYAVQSPDDSLGDALAIAAPLVVAGIVAIVAGRPVPKKTPVFSAGGDRPAGAAGTASPAHSALPYAR